MAEKDDIGNYNKMKEEILSDYERLDLNDKFTFKCDSKVSCFGQCCRNVNILLTPYCVMRLKNHLGISSEEFISKYAISPAIDKENRIPLLFLKMSDSEEMTCQFLTDEGCSVYEDRPWACRMYPLGVASQKTVSEPMGNQFYYLIQDEKCKGHGEGEEITLAEYVVNQGVPDYEMMNDLFKELTLHPFFQNEENLLPPQQVQMFYMACYNLDMFRRFLFNSRFFDIMDMNEKVPEMVKDDDEVLLKFAFEWLRYSFFGEGSIKIKEEILEEKKKELEEKKNNTDDSSN